MPNLSPPNTLPLPQLLSSLFLSFTRLYQTLLVSLQKRFNPRAALAGDEDHLLNGIWFFLLSLEALIVLGVLFKAVVRGLRWRIRRRKLGMMMSRPGSSYQWEDKSRAGQGWMIPSTPSREKGFIRRDSSATAKWGEDKWWQEGEGHGFEWKQGWDRYGGHEKGY
ncbi:hypothetical protein QBC40DRAFT_301672 [Triangularia verruculosa]|uniref:Uncharacterized protein n=1 Tax=Triangularia verruculosa TaxID=2587418 RepID=A0AAN6X7I9_9PEZI|nr:hypothetical protein QBC40DRAFT_301672 [Triangularia verruculosa]